MTFSGMCRRHHNEPGYNNTGGVGGVGGAPGGYNNGTSGAGTGMGGGMMGGPGGNQMIPQQVASPDLPWLVPPQPC